MVIKSEGCRKSMHNPWITTALCLIGFGLVGDCLADNAVTAQSFTIEPPTLHCLGFEWTIQGDDNHNATVTVEYRRKGAAAWREALPLLRIGEEKVWRSREFLEHWTPRMFAGSIFDLDADTEYGPAIRCAAERERQVDSAADPRSCWRRETKTEAESPLPSRINAIGDTTRPHTPGVGENGDPEV